MSGLDAPMTGAFNLSEQLLQAIAYFSLFLYSSSHGKKLRNLRKN
ncbi:MAG: hypothetical protein ABIH36_02180 [bacterium]